MAWGRYSSAIGLARPRNRQGLSGVFFSVRFLLLVERNLAGLSLRFQAQVWSQFYLAFADLCCMFRSAELSTTGHPSPTFTTVFSVRRERAREMR